MSRNYLAIPQIPIPRSIPLSRGFTRSNGNIGINIMIAVFLLHMLKINSALVVLITTHSMTLFLFSVQANVCAEVGDRQNESIDSMLVFLLFNASACMLTLDFIY